jgi:hypothetical protein
MHLVGVKDELDKFHIDQFSTMDLIVKDPSTRHLDVDGQKMLKLQYFVFSN